MILFVRDLTVIDFSYLCAKRGVLGESWIVDVELHGDLDDTSMVFDFAKVKKVIKQIIDSTIDHKLAYPALHPSLHANQDGEQHIIRMETARGRIQVASPPQGHVAIAAEHINEQAVVDFLLGQIKPALPVNVGQLVIQLRPEKMSGFYYHYTHGLKKHDGNCQRIAHGHRSLIEIFQNNMLNPRLNKSWAERWEDIYLASAEDQIQSDQLRFLEPSSDSFAFAYRSGQGYFEIVLPMAICEIVPCDTTVECLAQYIADTLAAQEVGRYKVVAYEGIGKGAIGFADSSL
jgi:6-pyruvoyl-tetrahydropterin synthase